MRRADVSAKCNRLLFLTIICLGSSIGFSAGRAVYAANKEGQSKATLLSKSLAPVVRGESESAAKSCDALVLKAKAELKHGNAGKATEYFRAAAKLPPARDFELNHNLVCALAERNDIALAESFVERVRRSKPDAPDASVLAAVVQYELDQYEQAKSSLKKVLAAKKIDDQFVLICAAQSFMQLGCHTEAYAALDRAEREWPKTTHTQYWRALVLLDDRRFKDAQTLLRGMLKSKHRNFSLVLLVEADKKLGDFSGLIEDCKGFNPNNSSPHLTIKILTMRGDAYKELHHYGEAIRDYDQVVSRGEANKVLLSRAECCEKLGRTKEAADDRKRAAKYVDDYKPFAPVKRL